MLKKKKSSPFKNFFLQILGKIKELCNRKHSQMELNTYKSRGEKWYQVEYYIPLHTLYFCIFVSFFQGTDIV